jgi:CRP-like cAMP-binding protein
MTDPRKEVKTMIPLEEMQDVMDFEAMEPTMVENLSFVGEILTSPEGTYLFREGERAESYYIVKDGKVALEFRQEDGSVFSETVGPGMGVGCSALAGLRAYMSDARCETPSKLLRWSQSTLRHMFNQKDRLGYMMMKACAMSLNARVVRKLEKE